MTSLLTFLHLFGLALSLGGAAGFLFVLYPALKAIESHEARMKILGNSLRYYHPLFLFGICLTFMSGAIHLTDFKIAFGTQYFSVFGKILLWKFGMTLLIFLIAGMQCFGMGLKLTRMVNGVIPGDLATQERYAKKIWRAQIVNLVLLAVTLWLGLEMAALSPLS
jgi:uncharacterized membrane protein